MYQNKFLDNFILNRQKDVDNANDKHDKKGRVKSRHGTKTGKNEVSGGDAFALLVEEMPGRAKVLEYFRDRIADLNREEMEK